MADKKIDQLPAAPEAHSADLLIADQDKGSGVLETRKLTLAQVRQWLQNLFDGRFLRQSQDLADLNDASAARDNLGLGSAATVDTGTASGNVPTNADLGSAAYVDTGTASGNVPTNADLGSAAYVDTGTASGEVRTNTQNDGRFARLSGGAIQGRTSTGDVLVDNRAGENGETASIATTTASWGWQVNGDWVLRISKGGSVFLQFHRETRFNEMPKVDGSPIVESGSNANGSWTKWADGTMICEGRTASASTTDSFGTGLYRSPNVTHTLPQTFVEAPIVQTTYEYDSEGSSSSGFCGYINQATTSSIRFRIYSDSDSAQGFVHFTAKGRWK